MRSQRFVEGPEINEEIKQNIGPIDKYINDGEKAHTKEMPQISIRPNRAVEQEDLPIKQGEIFDPDFELEKIRALTKDKRPAACERYKRKFMFQKRGLAEMQAYLTHALRNNPDTDAAGLMPEMEKLFQKKYGLTNGQMNTIETILREFNQKHLAVHKMRVKHPDDNGLFEALFGRSPLGAVKIIEGPITLYISCHDPQDYALIHSQNFLSGRQPDEKNIAAANKTGGVSLATAKQPELRGCITAENAHHKKPGQSYDQNTLIHEEQHAIKRLFKEALHKQANYGDLLNAKTEKERSLYLKRWLRCIKEQGEQRAKDEIIALLKEHDRDLWKTIGPKTKEWIYMTLTKPRDKGGLYDYFAEERKDLIENLTDDLGEQYRPLIKKTIKKIFITEYQSLIKNGIEIFLSLRGSKYSLEQVIGLLINEPLSKWPKVKRRITENRY